MPALSGIATVDVDLNNKITHASQLVENEARGIQSCCTWDEVEMSGLFSLEEVVVGGVRGK